MLRTLMSARNRQTADIWSDKEPTHSHWLLHGTSVSRVQKQRPNVFNEGLCGFFHSLQANAIYSHALHNDVSVNDGPHIRPWSRKIII